MIPGYVFTTRERLTAYYLDAPPACAPTPVSSHPVAPQHPTNVSIWNCLPYADTAHPSSDAHCRNSRHSKKADRRRFAGPHSKPAPTDSVSATWWTSQGLWAVDTVNAGSFKSSADYRNRTAADAVIMQETKAAGKKVQWMHNQACKGGFKIESTPAKKSTHGGRSAGAAVMVKKRLAIDAHHGLQLTSEPHRAVFAQTSIGQGCTLISLYLRHSEGLSADNRRLLEEAAGELAQIKGPWIIGMDANMEPDIMRRSQWPELVGGTIFAPTVQTCGAATLDYFIVSKDLAPSILGTQVLLDSGFFPHKAVRLLIKGGHSRRSTRTIKRPPRIPGRLPLGPHFSSLASRNMA